MWQILTKIQSCGRGLTARGPQGEVGAGQKAVVGPVDWEAVLGEEEEEEEAKLRIDGSSDGSEWRPEEE